MIGELESGLWMRLATQGKHAGPTAGIVDDRAKTEKKMAQRLTAQPAARKRSEIVRVMFAFSLNFKVISLMSGFLLLGGMPRCAD